MGYKGCNYIVVSRQIFHISSQTSSNITKHLWQLRSWFDSSKKPPARLLVSENGGHPKITKLSWGNGAIYSVLFVSPQLSDKPWWYIITHNSNYIYIYMYTYIDNCHLIIPYVLHVYCGMVINPLVVGIHTAHTPTMFWPEHSLTHYAAPFRNSGIGPLLWLTDSCSCKISRPQTTWESGG